VLVGLEVPEAEEPAFAVFLGTLGYPYLREVDNEAYRRFLTASA
jgi:threonine dehydratase